MTVEELQVLITANTKGLQKEIANTNKTVSGLQKSVSKSTGGIMTAFKGLASGLMALGIGKIIADSIKTGMDAIESDSLFETSLGKYADDVRNWSNEVSNTLGLNAVAMRKNTGVIYNMTTSMGLAENNALSMSKGISLLSEDMASFYNLSSDEAFNKLRAGLTGETEPLKALGILVDENTIKQVAYQNGIAKTGTELTQQQKVLARYMAILQQTGNAQGDLARTIDSPSNQLRILKNQVSQLGLAFGNLLLPILQAVLPYLTAFAKVVTMALNSLSQLLAKVFGFKLKDTSSNMEGINAGIEGMTGGLGGAEDSLDGANKKAKKLKNTLAGFDEMNVLQDNSTDTGAGGSSGGAGVGGDLGFNLGDYEYGLDGLNTKVNDIANNIKSKFTELGGILSSIWNSEPVQAFSGAVMSYGNLLWTYWSSLGTTLLENITLTWSNIEGNVSTILTNMTTLWTQFWTDIDAGIQEWGDPIVKGVTGVFDSIWKDAVDPSVQLITKTWADFSGILVKLWEQYGTPLVDKVGEFVDNIVKLFQKIWDKVLEPIITPFLETLSWLWEKHIKGLVEEVGEFVGECVNFLMDWWNKFILPLIGFLIDVLAPAWASTWEWIIGIIGTVVGVIVDIVAGIIRTLKGIVQFVSGVFTGDWDKAWTGIKNIFGGIWDMIVGVVKGCINLVIDAINSMIAGINKVQFDVPDWVPVLGGEHVGLKIPKIKKLAKGGIVTSPTYAQIGEAGKEAVLPLDNNLGYLDKLADKINAKNGDGQPVRVVVNIGEDTIIDKIVEGINSKNFETNGEVFA